MPRPVPGPGALVSYIRTGAREARTAYRELPDKERVAYRDTVRRVYDAAIARHFGERVSSERMHDLAARIGERHPNYAGGVRVVLRSTKDGTSIGRMVPRQVLTAQHLVIREVAKLHADFRDGADQIVKDATRTPAMAGSEVPDPIGESDFAVPKSEAEFRALQREYIAMRDAEAEADEEDAEFAGTDPDALAAVTLGLDGSMRALELRRGVERLGGKAIGTAVMKAWVDAEKQRWSRAKELERHDSFPEVGSGKGKGDTFRCQAYSKNRLCRATVDRYGRLRAVTFMRTSLFDDGRQGLADDLAEAVAAAQRRLAATW